MFMTTITSVTVMASAPSLPGATEDARKTAVFMRTVCVRGSD